MDGSHCVRLTLRASASSGWLPAVVLALAAAVVLVGYGTPVPQVAVFGAYVAFGIALPGPLWVRLLRGRATHIAEDLTLGLVAGYCVEIATYLAARALGREADLRYRDGDYAVYEVRRR